MEGKTLRQMLEVTDAFVSEISALQKFALGPQFSDCEPAVLHEQLVLHRIVSKYEVPNADAAAARAELSILEVLQHDANGFNTFDYRALPPEVRKDFLLARGWLTDFFTGFSRKYALRFPSGETYTPARGMTDLLYKLKDLDQWTVSPDLVIDVVHILCRHRCLLAVVKQRFKERYGELGRYELSRLRQYMVDNGYNDRKIRFESVRYMFRSLTKLVRVSRVTTVPKNNKRDRVITCECLWTMVAQLSFSADLREHMKCRLGIDLSYTQLVHRSLIGTGKATIDLSKASDSNYMVVLEQLFPTRIFRFLQRMRTGIFEVDGTFVPLNMFAPMGCGCTFEVMTLTLLAHCRVLDPGASVFGDDIIINPSQASRLMKNLESQGWVINENKSFVTGPFRESCGGFFDLRAGHLLSFDLPRPSNMREMFTFLHKVWKIGHALPQGVLRCSFAQYYAKSLLLVPRDSFLEPSDWSLTNVSLLEWGVYSPRSVSDRRLAVQHTGVTRCLSTYWQRPIRVTHELVEMRSAATFTGEADRTEVACFLRRGGSYEPPGRAKPLRRPIDLFTGTPLRGVLLASVIH